MRKAFGKIQVLTAATFKVIVFWYMVSYSPVGADCRFRIAYFFHHQGDDKLLLRDNKSPYPRKLPSSV